MTLTINFDRQQKTADPPSSAAIHAWIENAYRNPIDPAQMDDRRFTRWNMEVAYVAGWKAAIERAKAILDERHSRSLDWRLKRDDNPL